MSAAAYREILEKIQILSEEERILLLQALSSMGDKGNGKRSVLELRGLGKELWAGMDAQEYVDRERSSWNG